MMRDGSHPRTHELMYVAYRLSIVLYPFKVRYNRARPAQLSPTLRPLALPGHPSYPSGHGFQGWMVALVLAEVRPDARAALLALGERIGVNRVIAGVHYPSDIKAGHRLAEQMLEIAREGKQFQELLAAAKAEWR
jgi:acid phosphatase (class A)